MHFYSKSLLLFTVILGCLLPQTYAEEATTAPSPIFHYNIEADLSYLDKLENLRANNSLSSKQEIDGPRTLGLSYLRLGLRWEIMNESSLHLVFRPDASIQRSAEEDGPAMEFDSRAGDVYFKPTKIYLLNAYQLTKKFSEGFSVTAGVFEKLAERQTSYKPILEFGLLVPLPQSFSALEVSWQSFEDDAPTAQSKTPSGYNADVYVIQGDRDRGEIRTYGSESYDYGPSSRDPQYGAAVAFSKVNSFVNEFGLILGMADTDMEALEREEASTKDKDKDFAKIKRNEVYAQLYNITQLENLHVPLKIAADIRFLKEKFKSDELSIASRQHYSGSLTTSARFANKHWILVGGHMGKNEIADDQFVDGYQWDLGYMQLLAQGLYMTILTSQELRKNDEEEGAFSNDENSDSTLHRIGFELKYSL